MTSTTDMAQDDQDVFAHQYSAEDKEHEKCLQQSANTPPILEDSMNREPSTPSMSEILENYENKFAHRFTSEDEAYQNYVQRPADPPPLVEGWQNRSGGNQRYRDRSRDNRSFRSSGYRSDQPGGYRSDRRPEKSWGSSYQRHQPRHSSFSQRGWSQHGYGSYSQGPSYGRY